MELTARVWDDRPRDGWLTYVWPSRISSSIPGYCFRRAGWRHDRAWAGEGRLLRLRSPIR